MKRILLLGLFFLSQQILAQTVPQYTTGQAHSHNDYEHKRAFWEAYDQQFGSIEADIFLVNDTLYTAHNLKDITPEKTLMKMYLEPIIKQTAKNNGGIYAQKTLTLQLLIDLKTPADKTLPALVKLLEPYKELFAPLGSIKIVVSGSTPSPENFAQYPAFISFDGRPEITYTPQQLERVGLISQAFPNYSKWNGEGAIPDKEKKAIQKVVQQSHDLGKKFRFWAIPDNINSWKTMMALQVDYLNTDKVVQMGDYLRTAPR